MQLVNYVFNVVLFVEFSQAKLKIVPNIIIIKIEYRFILCDFRLVFFFLLN